LVISWKTIISTSPEPTRSISNKSSRGETIWFFIEYRHGLTPVTRQLNLSGVDGRMSFEAADGRFLKTSGATEGTLRVVGILNLTEVVRRLSLDLSNVYKSGVPFDTLEGELSFQQGHIEVPDIDVRSRSSRLQFAGMAETASRTVDGELVATLPIASNLPWLFALVSGLPAAAGVYVVSKLFDDQMDRFSSAVYRVDGSWADPEVSFERIFDNKPGQPTQPDAAQPDAAQPDAARPDATESGTAPADTEKVGPGAAPPG